MGICALVDQMSNEHIERLQRFLVDVEGSSKYEALRVHPDNEYGATLINALKAAITCLRNSHAPIFKDCREIVGDKAVLISWTTAEEALRAMEHQASAGAYKELYADDASFVRAAIAELQKAVDD